MTIQERPFREVRAHFTSNSVVVYQAFSDEIADAALSAGTLVSPFRFDRMTWLKPSFTWMMYRSGWGTKPGQKRILAITVSRSGFDRALENATLSRYDPKVHDDASDWHLSRQRHKVVVQWDPERDAALRPLPWRTIQIGLPGEVARTYAATWVLEVADVSAQVRHLAALAPDAREMPLELRYPVPVTAARRLGVTPG